MGYDSSARGTTAYSMDYDYSSARGRPAYNYDDPRNNATFPSARGKPVYNYDDPRNYTTAFSAASARYTPEYIYKDHIYHDHSSRPRPPMPSDGGCGFSKFPGASFTDCRGGRPWPPMPAGPGRFKFPEPVYNDGRADSSGPRQSFSTQEFRPSEGVYSTHEFKPSWCGSSTGSSEYSHSSYSSYSSSSSSTANSSPPGARNAFRPTPSPCSPPRPSHKSSRPSSSSSRSHSSRTRGVTTHGIKPPTCFYTILGISRTATSDEIKRAYRKMSMKHHPDRVAGADKATATAKMAEINEANDILGDPGKRQVYDRTGCVPRSC